MTAILVAALALSAPVPPDAGKPPAAEAKLHGEWIGNGSCQGDVTFDANGTYSWVHYGPGNATVAGKWAMRWDALPPTLVLTSTASDDKDCIGATAEVKVLRLDGKTLLYEQNGYKVEFTREPKGEPKKEQDAKLIQGRWKVVKDEYLAGKKWTEAEVPTDFAFVFTGEAVTVTRQKTRLDCTLNLTAAEKAMNLVRAAGGIDKLERCIYKLDGDRLTICVVGGHLLPAEDAAKGATIRLYRLERVVEPKK